MRDPFRSGEAPGCPVEVFRDGDRLSVVSDGRVGLRLRLGEQKGRPRLVIEEAGEAAPAGFPFGIAAALEALTATQDGAERIDLDPVSFASLAPPLCERGLALRDADGGLFVHSGMLWQRPEPWLSHLARRDYPALPVMTEGRRHPRRPPKPTGTLYSRFLPWLGLSIAFRAASLADLDQLHRWMNDPRVDAVWGEAGPREKHAAYLAGLIADPHMIPLIGSFGGEPFGYFEIYWAKENRLAPFYDAHDYDRGWHVLIGEERFRGRPYVSAWLPSLMHALFLDDPRTDRIVGEPRADHAQQLRNLERSGFARIKTFDFPHKRAALVTLSRERFFGERLWAPNPAQVRPAAEEPARPAAEESGAAA
ncbi:GNAT family N-acetyltransferase [Methylobacterium sp. ID0610]|uniref:GNAT family N-acetyltransferase n=1 Tax=Methylobacterium carpenticola TaxID=3344827 RepID=UPI003676E6D2